jgi:hypothetical protein
MTFAAKIAGVDVSLDTVWQHAETRSERDFWEIAQARRDRGVSDQAILREWGYTQEEILRFEEEISASDTVTGNAVARAFNAGTSLV